ncbi:MAG: D-alanyl-D-alanine carboxypeptidase/D-alanyl-D-alanine-endopeptidase, partial [Desulfobacteraceae bacterium]|nr:D-alanyl-D-alanine carboxypeptidase/D-alanyl-D-alanine-endopeptidase [Desulfobacteraceae bacterium]
MVINCAMKAHRKKLFVVVVFSVCLVSFARADLVRRIDSIISQSSQRKVQFSIHIVKPDSGKTIYNHNASKALVPASNMKIIVTAAALKYLGQDYEYKTQVGLCGTYGTGDTLVVAGGGDPLFGDRVTDAKYGRQAGWIFEDITAALREIGVTSIKDIIIDSSIFDDERVRPNWPRKELNRWYACEVSGLNYNGNCIEVTARSAGGGVELTIEPETSYVKIINRCRPTVKPPNTVWCSRAAGANTITVLGKCYKQCQPVRVTVERPAAFFGFLLAENLARAGITLEGQLIERQITSAEKIETLKTYKTKLPDVLARCNKDSFALGAEALVKTVAAHSNRNCKDGSWAAGRAVISQYLLSLGVDKGQFYIDDGSGLSKENKLSANAITKVLLDIYRSEDWRFFKNSLAAGGIDGTIG